MSISLKELRETKTWLRITRRDDPHSAERLHELTDETGQLCAVLSQSAHMAEGEGGGRWKKLANAQ
ncbi:four helix bundle protein [Salinibacter grassmerensis]|uniref:four helix bundle protein n=1 Tax=Salinibacter grassmerensis TaxID=3040353 RepID=UPI0021E8D211|nr:four helix bundle protein [Salinibacter grassmerensis]